MLPLTLDNHFKLLKGVAILNSPYSKSDVVGSWLDCAIYCPVTSGCIAVNYNSEENACYFYDWNSISVEPTSGSQQTSMAVNTGTLSKPNVTLFFSFPFFSILSNTLRMCMLWFLLRSINLEWTSLLSSYPEPIVAVVHCFASKCAGRGGSESKLKTTVPRMAHRNNMPRQLSL